MDSILEASEETWEGGGLWMTVEMGIFFFKLPPSAKKKKKIDTSLPVYCDWQNQFGWQEQRLSHMDGIMSGRLDSPLTGAADRKRWK